MTLLQRHLERSRRRGFSLAELLIVVALLAIAAAVVVPNSSTSMATDLVQAAEVVVAELDYVRNLAVTYGSSYEATYSDDGTQLLLAHSGSNSSLDTLPAAPFGSVNDDPTQRVLRINELTSLAGDVRIVGAVAVTDSGDEPIASIEFGPLGETTRSETTQLWLANGRESARRYVAIEINPITGLATPGDVTSTLPAVLSAEKAEGDEADD